MKTIGFKVNFKISIMQST